MGITSENKLFSKYVGAGRADDIVMATEDVLVLPSNVLTVNWLMGGGLPYGRILELLGEESSGKSLLAMDFVKNAQRAGGMGIWIDAENSFTESWAELNGLDLGQLVIFTDTAVETISDFIADACPLYRDQLRNNEPIVVVVDSTAALDSLDALATSQEDSKAEMGNRAKAIYKMLRIRNKMFTKLGICVIFINQLRDKIQTGFIKTGDDDTSPGGKAIRFYAAVRLGLYVIKQVRDSKKRRVGSEVSIRVKKNKIAPPRSPIRGQMIFDPDYDEVGFDKYFGLSELLIEQGIFEKSGNAFLLNGEKIAAGADALDDAIRNDKDIRADIIEAADLYTMKTFRKRIEKITKNLYPVDYD